MSSKKKPAIPSLASLTSNDDSKNEATIDRPVSARASDKNKDDNDYGRNRPQSTRASTGHVKSKSKRNLAQDAQWTRMMAGLKTPKEKQLAETCINLRRQSNDKDSVIKKLESSVNKMKIELQKFKDEQSKKGKQIDRERKLRTKAIKEEQQIRAVMQKIQGAVTARMKMLGIDFSNINSIGEALDASLKAINKLVAELEEKDKELLKLQQENQSLKDLIEKQKLDIESLKKELAKKNQIIDNQSKQLVEQGDKIKKLEGDNEKLRSENEKLQNELNALKKEYNDFKKAKEKEINDLKNKIQIHEKDKIEKDTRIKDLEERIADLEKQNNEQRNVIADQSKRIAELEKEVSDKDKQIKELLSKIAELEKENERLNAIINKPKDDREAQTEISGAIDKQLSDYPRLLKEIVALRNKLERKNQIIKDLQDENKQLLLDIEWLLKKAAKFYPDISPHTGIVEEMRASPNEMIVATGATDFSVRLWKIRPDKKDKNAIVFQRSIIDGEVGALAWSKDGKFLAGGTGFRDGPEGFLVIWDMIGDTKYEVLHAIRSRPTIRFGRITCLVWSNDNEFVFCGDSKGSIWAINCEKEKIVAHLECHTDVVYDLALNNDNQLYSVSHEGSLAIIMIPKDCNGPGNDDEKESDNALTLSLKNDNSSKKKKNDSAKRSSKKDKSSHAKTRSKTINLPKSKNGPIGIPRSSRKSATTPKSPNRISRAFEPKRQPTLKELLEEKDEYQFNEYKGIVLERDGKYPFWRVAITDDDNNKLVCCASRKVRVFKVLGNGKIEETCKITDADMDHVKSLHIKNGYILTTRQMCGRVKLFDLKTGKEAFTFKSKQPIAQADFMCDGKTVVALQQEYEKKKDSSVMLPQTPVMKLFSTDKDNSKKDKKK